MTRERGCVCSTARAAGGDGMVAAKDGGEDRRAVEGTEVKGMGLERSEGGLPRLEEEEEEEEEAALPERKVAECTLSLASGLVVSDRGCACSECVAAGAAGDASAADGVAGESSMLPCDEAGLAQGFSAGRYCTHGFLLLDTREPGMGWDGVSGHSRAGGKGPGGYSLSVSWLCCCCCCASFSRFLFFFLPWEGL